MFFIIKVSIEKCLTLTNLIGNYNLKIKTKIKQLKEHLNKKCLSGNM